MSEERARDAVAALAVVVITTTVLFAPLFLGGLRGEPRFFEWDVPEQYWGDLVLLCRSLHQGELPAWNPYDRAGYPYYADPQAALYHPIAWGICALAGPSPGLGWQEARVIVGFLCAGGFGLLWLRRLGASWAAAALGAVAIECAPFMRHNWELNLTSALGWLTMVLWALERLLTERRSRDAALLALAQALLIWSGSPPAAWLAGSFTALYALGRLLEIGRREGTASLRAVVPRLALAAILAIGLGAAVLVPGLTLAEHSVQSGRSYESLSEGGIDPRGMLALIWPRDGNHLYVGWIVLALAPLAWWRRERLPGRAVLALAAIAAVLLAMGDHGPLFRIAFEVVPGVRLFRLPHRYEAWLGPAMGALAAGGLDAVRERLARVDRPRAIRAATALALLGVAAWVVVPGAAPAALLLGAASVAAASAARRPSAWPVASIVLGSLLLIDVSQRLPEDRHTRSGPPPGGADTAARVLPRAPGTDVAYRYLDEFGISCRSGTRLARRDLRGYQDPLLLHAYERVMASLREHPEVAQQFNVRYALTGPHFIHGWDRHYLPPPDVLLAIEGASDRGEGVIDLGPRTMPLAYFVDESGVERVARREDALARVIARAPGPLAILEDGAIRPAATVGVQTDAVTGTPPWRPADVTAFGTDALSIAVDAPHPGMLIVNEAWYPGWIAEVDGAPAPVLRANGLVRAVAVPEGARVVELRFAPADLRPLRGLLAASWAILILLSMPWRQRTAGPSG
jgi:hypothetical protein